MKFFMVEGTLQNIEQMNEKVMMEHKSYTQKEMDAGNILMAGLKEDMSGGLFIMKSDSLAHVQTYLENEPFYTYGVQTYRIIEFSPHFLTQNLAQWLEK